MEYIINTDAISKLLEFTKEMTNSDWCEVSEKAQKALGDYDRLRSDKMRVNTVTNIKKYYYATYLRGEKLTESKYTNIFGDTHPHVLADKLKAVVLFYKEIDYETYKECSKIGSPLEELT